MSDDGDKLQKAVSRATEAKRLVAEPLLIEAFDRIEREVSAALTDDVAKMDDSQLRQIATVGHVARKVRRMLSKVIADGDAARIQIRNLMVDDAAKARRARKKAA